MKIQHIQIMCIIFGCAGLSLNSGFAGTLSALVSLVFGSIGLILSEVSEMLEKQNEDEK